MCQAVATGVACYEFMCPAARALFARSAALAHSVSIVVLGWWA
jgi:hypothetical protein